MNVRKLGENVFLFKVDNKTDIVSLFLLFSLGSIYVVREVYWQPKIRGTSVVERGKRRKVKVKLMIEKVYLEKHLNNLRLTGRVADSLDREVKGRGMGLTVNVGDKVIVEVDEELVERYVFRTKFGEEKVIVFNFDDVQATLSLINSGVKLIDHRYYGSGKNELGSILDKIHPLLREAIRLKNEYRSKLVIASTSVFLGYLKSKLKVRDTYFLETGSSGDFFGLLEIMRDKRFHELAPRTLSVFQSRILEMVKRKLIAGEIVYGLNEVLNALKGKTCKTLISTSLMLYELLDKNREKVERLVLSIKEVNGNFIIVEVNSELGTLVSSMGGLVCV